MQKFNRILFPILLVVLSIFLAKHFTYKSWQEILNYSQKWDAHNYNKHAFAQYEIAVDALSHWKFTGNEKVLDIGCGDGSISAVIAKKYVPNGSVLAIDLSKDMIDFANKKHNLKNLKFQVIDASDIRCNNEYDLITSFYCIHWIKDQQAFVDNISKCLKPNGKILFYIMTEIDKNLLQQVFHTVLSDPKWATYFKDYQIPWYFKNKDEFAEIVKNSGLELLDIQFVPEKILFDNVEDIKSWVKAIPVANHLPVELRESFMHDLLLQYSKIVPVKKDGTIDFILPTLVVVAQKNVNSEIKNISKDGSQMSPDYNEKFMKRAIELSRIGSIVKKTGGVFGAVIVKDGKIIGEGYNQVIKENDPTWHGEIQAIRAAAKKLGNPHLTGCVLYTSAECCPMCLAAAYWANIKHIYYGATMEDALKYGDFKDVDFTKQICMKPEDRIIKSTQIMQKEAVEVWKDFSQMPDRARY